MGNFTATDWTLTLQEQRIQNKERRNYVKMVLATAANDGYPTGGIPIPTTPGDYGMVRNLDHIIIYDASNTASGWLWKYGASGNVFRAFRPTSVSLACIEATAAAVLAGQTFYVEAVGW